MPGEIRVAAQSRSRRKSAVLLATRRGRENKGPRPGLLLAILLAAALLLRIADLARMPFWIDEAESAINALSILDFGYPTGTYLGMPVYENTLVLPWPESPEYEFKDSSYSSGNLALYHGWLPLYAIAGSFWLFGIHPPPEAGGTTPLYSEAERRRRTMAARFPGVLFGVLSIAGLYLAGSRLHSRNAGLVAALIGCLLALHISFSQQSRYYGATLAGAAFAAWSLERMARSSRWRDYLMGAAIFAFLFYTHLTSFAIVCVVWAGYQLYAWMRARRRSAVVIKSAAFCAILGAACLPWLLATGFLRHLSGIPMAWRLMSFPRDLIIARAFESEFGVLIVIGLILWSLGTGFRRWTGRWRIFTVFRMHSAAFGFLYLWLAVGYLVFLFLTPAASFWISRFAMTLLVPVILLIAMLLCSGGRVLSRRRPMVPAVAGALLFVAISNLVRPLPSAENAARENRDVDTVVEYLRDANLPPATLLFSFPTDHLVLSFYTGLPIQSIAPVRKSFLDSYPGPVLLFEREDLHPTAAIKPALLRRAAAAAGRPLGDAEAAALSCEIASSAHRTQLLAEVASVHPSPGPIPAFAAEPERRFLGEAWRSRREMNRVSRAGPPFFRRAEIVTLFDWWNQFFYAFVDPEWRKRHPNYGDRMRNATATTLPCSDWTAIYSPARPPASKGGHS